MGAVPGRSAPAVAFSQPVDDEVEPHPVQGARLSAHPVLVQPQHAVDGDPRVPSRPVPRPAPDGDPLALAVVPLAGELDREQGARRLRGPRRAPGGPCPGRRSPRRAPRSRRSRPGPGRRRARGSTRCAPGPPRRARPRWSRWGRSGRGRRHRWRQSRSHGRAPPAAPSALAPRSAHAPLGSVTPNAPMRPVSPRR